VSRLTANVFGSAAGGGFPQWNCNGEVCRLAWAGDPRVRRGFIHFDLFLICFYFGFIRK
jgi:phosphoribosyl 1,2-cyclic phosphodiesterase